MCHVVPTYLCSISNGLLQSEKNGGSPKTEKWKTKLLSVLRACFLKICLLKLNWPPMKSLAHDRWLKSSVQHWIVGNTTSLLDQSVASVTIRETEGKINLTNIGECRRRHFTRRLLPYWDNTNRYRESYLQTQQTSRKTLIKVKFYSNFVFNWRF